MKTIYNFIKRTVICIILFFLLCIFLNNDKNYNKYSKKIFEDSIDFTYIRSKTNKLLGKYGISDNKFVSSEKIKYKNINKINNSYDLEVDDNYIIKNRKEGIVIFIGDKEDLGKTIIISGIDGIEYWYSNIENISVNLYDNVKENEIIGSTIDNHLIITLMKDNEYLEYEKYF